MRILEKSQDFSRISISYLLCLFNPSSALTLTLLFLAFKLLFEKILHHFFAFIRTD